MGRSTGQNTTLVAILGTINAIAIAYLSRPPIVSTRGTMTIRKGVTIGVASDNFFWLPYVYRNGTFFPERPRFAAARFALALYAGKQNLGYGHEVLPQSREYT
jgi:ribose/xylose/arabinose/galactoside ABC-type transport system permease subunit